MSHTNEYAEINDDNEKIYQDSLDINIETDNANSAGKINCIVSIPYQIPLPNDEMYFFIFLLTEVVPCMQRVVDFAGVLNDESVGEDAEVGFSMDQIKDAVVAERTTSGYIGNITLFLHFFMDSTNAPYNRVVTDVGRENMMSLRRRQGERIVSYK
jgi:hypothetical protein